MRKVRNKLVGVVWLVCLLLTSCGNSFQTESGMKKIAEKALEEKYDEEFVIHKVWSRDSMLFYTTCSPE